MTQAQLIALARIEQHTAELVDRVTSRHRLAVERVTQSRMLIAESRAALSNAPKPIPKFDS